MITDDCIRAEKALKNLSYPELFGLVRKVALEIRNRQPELAALEQAAELMAEAAKIGFFYSISHLAKECSTYRQFQNLAGELHAHFGDDVRWNIPDQSVMDKKPGDCNLVPDIGPELTRQMANAHVVLVNGRNKASEEVMVRDARDFLLSAKEAVQQGGVSFDDALGRCARQIEVRLGAAAPKDLLRECLHGMITPRKSEYVPLAKLLHWMELLPSDSTHTLMVKLASARKNDLDKKGGRTK